MIKTGYHFAVSFIRLIFPRNCAGCRKDLYDGEVFICLHCQQAMVETDMVDRRDNAMFGMFRPFIPVRNAAAAYYYGGDLIIQKLMYEVKYAGNKSLARHMGNRLGTYLYEQAGWEDIDVIIPVPLHQRKRSKRGFNQSELICHGMAEIMDIPVRADVLYRKIRTGSQTNKSRTERWENVSSAFGIRDMESLKGSHILLVDDVVTTGATLLSCALTLTGQKHVQISLAAVAFAGEL